MKKKIILLLTCVALILPMGGVSAKNDKPLISDNRVISNNINDAKLDNTNIEGEILNIREAKNGILADMNDFVISIDDKSEIINEFDGKKLSKNDLKKGMKIRAYYGPAVTLSIPPMSYGRRIMVLQNTQGIGTVEQNIGNIVKFNNEKSAYIKSKDGAIFTFITEKTEIVNGKGEKAFLKDLKAEDRIKLYFDERGGDIGLKNYLPLIYMPEKIVILDKVETELFATQGKISKVTDSKNGVAIMVEGKKVTEFGYDAIRLNIDENTKIINAKDKKQLSYKDLKEGTEILAYYGGAVTRSLPPIGNGKEIIVLQ
ncbi:hypothetical protein [Clostridium lundense]|uniref:hypothetical protein n=1 Tax=Clostridium lundense TaxID=319475 RepID=UPI0004884899|nr:hypothetical protein [Clostridium lundense]